MSKKGDCYDNAMMESFWATLKAEGCDKKMFSSRKEAKAAVFEYIEVCYNRKRRHSSLGYTSPVDYEKQGEQGKVGKYHPLTNKESYGILGIYSYRLSFPDISSFLMSLP